jgi:hypothetical protein
LHECGVKPEDGLLIVKESFKLEFRKRHLKLIPRPGLNLKRMDSKILADFNSREKLSWSG